MYYKYSVLSTTLHEATILKMQLLKRGYFSPPSFPISIKGTYVHSWVTHRDEYQLLWK